MKHIAVFILTIVLFAACKKSSTNPNYTCTCKTTVTVAEGFTINNGKTDTVLINKQTFAAGTSATDAKNQCTGSLFWPELNDTFYVNHTVAGNGYIPSSGVICNL